jgi:tricorn protease
MCTPRLRLAILAAVSLPSLLHAQSGPPLLLREPALSATEICFSFGGDLWTVPRAGGAAHRLTAAPGNESSCHFSADGRWIAYTNTINHNADVYVVPATGGTPKRLTYHPGADRVRGWTPDGRVLFMSDRHGIALTQAGGAPRMFGQAPDAVQATVVDLPSVWDGSFSRDGTRLAYLPYPPANRAWKRYRGGRTTPIWLATLRDASIDKVPRQNSTDQWPMWIGDTVFFVSDRDGPATLYGYDTHTRRVARRLENRGLDLKYASAGPGAIVYEQFGTLGLYDLATGRTTAVPVRLAGELTGALTHWVPVGDKLVHPALSPTGVRAAFEARGEILTVPAKKGDARDITHTPGATERYPSWSPDGQSLAYFSDEGGAYHLTLRGQFGTGDPHTITLGDADTYYSHPVWSPDGKRIAYSTSRGEIWYADVKSGRTTRVDADPLGPQWNDWIPSSWSPDSRWLAYARSIKNRLGAVFVHDLEHGKSTQVTDGLSDVRTPAFDAGGKYLYFVASTDAGPASDFSMTTFDHPITRSLYAIVLRDDLPSPLAPESDEEKAKGDSAATSNAKAAAGDVKGAKAAKPGKDSVGVVAAPEPVRIDFAGIDQRTIALPATPRNYVAVVPGKSGIVVLAEQPLIPVDQQPDTTLPVTLHKFDLSERKTDELMQNVGDFDVSRDGGMLLSKQEDKWVIAPLGQPAAPADSGAALTAGAGGGGGGPSGGNGSGPSGGPLKVDEIQVLTDPHAEWADMYHEAFRLQRAYFYDPGYHGLDLGRTERYYERYLDGLGSRADLDYLLEEVFGNLTVGHLFVRAPDEAPTKTPANGLLGADYTIANGRWRFARVYAGENWNPSTVAPLTQPGVNVRAGEYLLAVDGRPLAGSDNIEQALEGTAGKSVVLRVGPKSDGSGARDVTVVPLESEVMLRHLAWIDHNRRTVDSLSGGKLAYIYVPNTANEGYTRFNRYFFAQQERLGAVVDERFNGGGNIADYMIDYLRRDAPFNYVTSRYGEDVPIPAGAIYGPKVMLINEYAGSGGDELPWLFRRFKVGPLIGTRTWGGLVGIGGYPALMDGGMVTAPRVALWSAEGEYAVENKGVAPDVEIDLEPAAWRVGRDSQLERAVAVLMADLAKRPPVAAKRPAFPTWAKGMGPSR